MKEYGYSDERADRRLPGTKRAELIPAARLFRGALEFGEGAARVLLSRLARALEFEDLGGFHKGKPKRVPNIHQAFHEMGDMGVRMQWAWRDAQPLSAPGNGWVIYGLDIDRVTVKQHVACAFTKFGVADMHGHDMGRILQYRQACGTQRMFGQRRLALMERAKRFAFPG